MVLYMYLNLPLGFNPPIPFQISAVSINSIARFGQYNVSSWWRVMQEKNQELPEFCIWKWFDIQESLWWFILPNSCLEVVVPLMWYFPFYAISQFSAKMLQICKNVMNPFHLTTPPKILSQLLWCNWSFWIGQQFLRLAILKHASLSLWDVYNTVLDFSYLSASTKVGGNVVNTQHCNSLYLSS